MFLPAEKINEKNENTSAADLLRARENQNRDFLVFFFHFFFGEKRRKRRQNEFLDELLDEFFFFFFSVS